MLKNMADGEDRPELPGSGPTPPLKGRSWLWVKMVVWVGLVLTLMVLAYLISLVLFVRF